MRGAIAVLVLMVIGCDAGALPPADAGSPEPEQVTCLEGSAVCPCGFSPYCLVNSARTWAWRDRCYLIGAPTGAPLGELPQCDGGVPSCESEHHAMACVEDRTITLDGGTHFCEGHSSQALCE